MSCRMAMWCGDGSASRLSEADANERCQAGEPSAWRMTKLGIRAKQLPEAVLWQHSRTIHAQDAHSRILTHTLRVLRKL
jgi:hypothetical protein